MRICRKGFLATLNNKAYQDICHLILINPEISFLDIYRLIKVIKDKGKVITRVISHVVEWLNFNPIKVANYKNNKPPL